MTLAMIDVIGFWVGIFLTFCILSFLYKDNPFYKLAEHLFVGVSVGYVVTKQYYDTLKPNLVDRLADHNWWYLIPLVLIIMLFTKAISRRWSWLGRYPIAFVVALYAGIQINAVAGADLAEQVKVSTQPVAVQKANINEASFEKLLLVPGISPPLAREIIKARESGTTFTSIDELQNLPGLTPAQVSDIQGARGNISGTDAQASIRSGETYWLGSISRLLMFIGLIASLVYFYFSIEQRGVVKKVSRFGIWVLMIGFGASFGFTVQGRLALAVGRAIDVLDFSRSPEIAAQINGPIISLISIGIIVAGLFIWERRQKRPPNAGADATTSGEG